MNNRSLARYSSSKNKLGRTETRRRGSGTVPEFPGERPCAEKHEQMIPRRFSCARNRSIWRTTSVEEWSTRVVNPGTDPGSGTTNTGTDRQPRGTVPAPDLPRAPDYTERSFRCGGVFLTRGRGRRATFPGPKWRHFCTRFLCCVGLPCVESVTVHSSKANT